MFPNLKAEMARKGITNEMLANSLEINVSTMSKKLNYTGYLKYNEAEKIKSHYFPKMSIDYLFAQEARENNKAS